MKKKQETIKSQTIFEDQVVYEEYPVLKWCPECWSENGYQSFDLWICRDCHEWVYIPPIKQEGR